MSKTYRRIPIDADKNARVREKLRKKTWQEERDEDLDFQEEPEFPPEPEYFCTYKPLG